MSVEIHRADWTIPYPRDLEAQRVPSFLGALTNVEHEWDAFPWHLAPRLVDILERPEPIFEYFHVTTFFRARAAMLTLHGGILYQKAWHDAVMRYQVQFGGIYRHHLLHGLRAFLKTNNFVELPECEMDMLDLLRGPIPTAANRDLVARVIRTCETKVVNTLNFISLATALDEVYDQYTVDHWVQGAKKPLGEDLGVQIRRHESGYHVMPSEHEAKATLRAGRTVTKSVVRFVRGARPASADANTGRLPSRNAGGVADRVMADKTFPRAEHGRSSWKVVGDYNVILLHGGRHKAHLGNRPKARAFLRFLCERLAKSGETEFYVDEVRDAFNAQFSGDLSHRQWVSDRFREDLFRGKEREFDLLFERLDKGTGRYRLRE